MKVHPFIVTALKFLFIVPSFFTLLTYAATPAHMLKVSYVQLDAVGSLSAIPPSAYAASNVLIFGFADVNSSSINQNYLSAMQTAIRNESPGTINLISIGGQTVNPDTINSNNISTIIDNITAQIQDYNNKLSGGKISGVDLDLENGIDSNVINSLAKGLKLDKKLLVSVAPQVINLSGPAVDPQNPVNLGLSSGGNANQYAEAIASGNVDYVMAQTYNSGGWTVGGYQESNAEFFNVLAQALNNSVQATCPPYANTLCIPAAVKIAVGLPSNAGASGTVNNVFASNGQTKYSQKDILTQLSNAVTDVLENQSHIAGVMQWSLNNDYSPRSWGDEHATPGAFSSIIFAANNPAVPYFILQVSNTGADLPGPSAYSTVTLVVENQGALNWWIFGANAPWVQGAGMTPLSPLKNQAWGTSTSAQNPNTPWVVDSTNLNSLFINSQTSFKTEKIIINGYSNFNSDVNRPNSQIECLSGVNYCFKAGSSYNIMVDAVHGKCAINVL